MFNWMFKIQEIVVLTTCSFTGDGPKQSFCCGFARETNAHSQLGKSLKCNDTLSATLSY